MNHQDLNAVEKVALIANFGGLVGLDTDETLTLIRVIAREYCLLRNVTREDVEKVVQEANKKKLKLTVKSHNLTKNQIMLGALLKRS
jgi:hypothetical protein